MCTDDCLINMIVCLIKLKYIILPYTASCYSGDPDVNCDFKGFSLYFVKKEAADLGCAGGGVRSADLLMSLKSRLRAAQPKHAYGITPAANSL